MHVFAPVEPAAVIGDAKQEGSPRTVQLHLDAFRLSVTHCVRQRLVRHAFGFTCHHGMQTAHAAVAGHAHIAAGRARQLGDRLFERISEILAQPVWSAQRLESGPEKST